MAGPKSSWCILRNSTKLRTLIKYKIRSKEFKIVETAEKAGVETYRLSRYLNSRTPNLTQFQLMKVCDLLGIEVSLDINIID